MDSQSQQPTGSISETDQQNETSRNWLDLPAEITTTIFSKLGAYDILNSVQWVCTNWLKISKDPSLWRSIHFHISSHPDAVTDEDAVVCSYMLVAKALAYVAVARSCGQLVEFSMEFVATDHFIHYLAQHASQIRLLRLTSCHNLTSEFLEETAHKFPHLEELELKSTLISDASIKAVGRGCPRMRSLKINDPSFVYPVCSDDIAEAMASTMPQLCHLQLIGNILTNEGLKVILNGCSSLESLDLRGSQFLDLKDDSVNKENFEHIKLVKYPNEPVGNNEFGTSLDHGCYFKSLDPHMFDMFLDEDEELFCNEFELDYELEEDR